MKKLLPRYTKISELYETVKNAPRIKSYLESERRQNYSMGVFRSVFSALFDQTGSADRRVSSRYYEELDEPK